MEDQCLDCYFVSDRSTERKSIKICDHTMHFEVYGYDIVREIPKEYYCTYFSAEKKPVYTPMKQHKKRGRPKKIQEGSDGLGI